MTNLASFVKTWTGGFLTNQDQGYLVQGCCQVLKYFVQDYLAAKDDKEHERELLAEVIVITITIITVITHQYCDHRDPHEGNLGSGRGIPLVGEENDGGGGGWHQA